MPLNQISQGQLHHITLWYLVQHSLASFYKLVEYFGSAELALNHISQWPQLTLHANHLKRANEFTTPQGQAKFAECLNQIQKTCDFILSSDDALYPPQLLPFVDRPPILFGQGQAHALLQAQIAIVGSRKPSIHGKKMAYDFAYYIAEKGFWITSGLAQGIDEAAHQGGLAFQRTIAVVATGLDQTYPPQHESLKQQIIQHQGAVISEFLPNTKPLQHHFPRRNRLVSALSLGVIVAEAALKSGSLITAKLAAEQGKHIFAIPGHIYSEYHRGCHQLIREGAILVDHPEQVLEDLALATQWHQQNIPLLSDEPQIPEHLMQLYNQLDWVGQSLDQLASALTLETAQLTAQLMELELFGLCMQQSGLYLRCRSTE